MVMITCCLLDMKDSRGIRQEVGGRWKYNSARNKKSGAARVPDVGALLLHLAVKI